MTDFMIKASARIVLGKKTKTLRKAGTLPVVLYGKGVDSRSLTVVEGDFLKVFKKAGESTLVDLAVDAAPPVKVIVHDLQRHPITNKIIHVDLLQVKMTEKLHTDIALHFVGEAAAVKELGGVLVKNLDHLKVEALPGDLVAEITVDISALKDFDSIIHVSDLVLPKGIESLDKTDEVIALVTPPRSEAELADLEKATVDEKAAVEQVEGVKKPEAEETEGEKTDDAAEPTKEKDKK